MDMDWMTALGLGFAIENQRRNKDEKKRLEQIANHRSELSDGIYALDTIFSDLGAFCSYSIEQNDLDDLRELAPLFPMEEILSLQGYIGVEQQLYLQDHFNLTRSRYNIGQFIKMAIDRTGEYLSWKDLAGLNEAFCGQIWHRLIEMVCRCREPGLMQQVIDALGKVLYHFWFLENADMLPAQIHYQRIISDLNFHVTEDQKTAYLHAVMLLQIKLVEKYGGSITDFDPCLDSEQTFCNDDKSSYLCFTVYGKDKSYSVHFYAVREIHSPSEHDLIWELPAGGGIAELFFTEQ